VPAVPVASFCADVPARSAWPDVTISSNGPPTRAGRLPWSRTLVVARAGSVSDAGTVIEPPDALITRSPLRRSTSARSLSTPNVPTRV
jgi:hypothetical protein